MRHAGGRRGNFCDETRIGWIANIDDGCAVGRHEMPDIGEAIAHDDLSTAWNIDATDAAHIVRRSVPPCFRNCTHAPEVILTIAVSNTRAAAASSDVSTYSFVVWA